MDSGKILTNNPDTFKLWGDKITFSTLISPHLLLVQAESNNCYLLNPKDISRQALPLSPPLNAQIRCAGWNSNFVVLSMRGNSLILFKRSKGEQLIRLDETDSILPVKGLALNEMN